jgi:NAD(P)-dependent dehydrogenase (short-subunit alcohol dehydrogenase family)
MKTVLVTGATRGIGREIALYFYQKGYRVFAVGRTESDLEALRSESNNGIETVVLDVTDNRSVDRARKVIEDSTQGAGVDILINNAGYGQTGPIELLSDEDWTKQYETNVFGLVRITRAFLPQMREKGWGRIINISSLTGFIALPFMGAYASSKHAVEGITEALRREVAPFGIKVMAVRPGAIKTGFGKVEHDSLQRYANIESPYQRFMIPFMQWQAKLHPNAPEPIHVVKDVYHAATARKPKSYYVSPKTNWGTLLLDLLLPVKWSDEIIRRITGLRTAERSPEPMQGSLH